MILNNFANLKELVKGAINHFCVNDTTNYTEVKEVKTIGGSTYKFTDKFYGNTSTRASTTIDGVSAYSILPNDFYLAYGLTKLTPPFYASTGGVLYPYFNGSGSDVYGGLTLWFGDGDTAPTAEDYKAGGNFIMTTPTSSYSVPSGTPALGYVSSILTKNEDGTSTISYTFINNSDTDVVVKEWGLLYKALRQSGDTDIKNPIMLTRDVIGNGGATIVPGDLLKISITIDW